MLTWPVTLGALLRACREESFRGMWSRSRELISPGHRSACAAAAGGTQVRRRGLFDLVTLLGSLLVRWRGQELGH